MKEITVSFIIPVFNVESYIAKCIDSIISQSIENKEIILVNDGSTDGSLSICKDYERKYPYIYVIDKKNEGVSIARNMGILLAKGKYVCFVDADDFFIKDFAIDFYEKCEKYNLDIIRGIYCLYKKNGIYDHCNLKQLSYYDQVLDGREFLKKSLKEKANEVVPFLGFFKRNFLVGNNIFFPEGISYEEDHLFFLKTLLMNNCKIMQRDTEFYAYRVREGSASKSPTIKKAKDVLWIVNEEIKLIEESKLNKSDIYYAKCFVSSSFYQLTSIYGRVSDVDRKKIKELCSVNLKKNYLKFNLDIHQKIKIFLFLYFICIVNLIYDLKFYHKKIKK